jgi:transcriptional regulator with XRE-family HTH domain
MSTFATRLKIAMQERNCSGRKLCEMINVHKSTISNYLNEVCEPKQDRLVVIAKALRVNPEWLAGEEVPMENNPTYEGIINIIKNLNESRLKKVYEMLVLMFGDVNE